jgi:hypothetical protein
LLPQGEPFFVSATSQQVSHANRDHIDRRGQLYPGIKNVCYLRIASTPRPIIFVHSGSASTNTTKPADEATKMVATDPVGWLFSIVLADNGAHSSVYGGDAQISSDSSLVTITYHAGNRHLIACPTNRFLHIMLGHQF